MKKLTKISAPFFLWLLTAAPLFAQNDPTGIKDARQENIDAGSIVDIIFSLAEWFLIFLGVIAVIMVLWSAFQFMTGAGNEDQIENAKKTLLWALVGVVVAILAFSIVQFVESLFFI